MLNHEAEGGLLDFVAGVEFTEIVKSSMNFGSRLSLIRPDRIGDPIVIKGIGCRYTLLRVKCQHLNNQIFSTLADIVPDAALDLILTQLHIVEDLNVEPSIERWIATEKHIEDYADAPDVALFIIVTL